MNTPAAMTSRTKHFASKRLFSSSILNDHGTQILEDDNSFQNIVRTVPEPYPHARKTPGKVCGRNGGPVMTDSDFGKFLHILDSAKSLKSARGMETFGDMLSNGHQHLPESGSSHGFQSGSRGG